MNKDIRNSELSNKLDGFMLTQGIAVSKQELLSLISEVENKARKEGYEKGFEDRTQQKMGMKMLYPLSEEAVREAIKENSSVILDKEIFGGESEKYRQVFTLDKLAHAIVQKFGKEVIHNHTEDTSDMVKEASDYEWEGEVVIEPLSHSCFLPYVKETVSGMSKLVGRRVIITVKEVK